MKRYYHQLFLAFAVAGFGTSVAAQFTTDELLSATKSTIEVFRKEQPEHATHFTGYKAWLSGEEAKVKVYATHEGMTMDFSFLCHKHDDSIECHAQ